MRQAVATPFFTGTPIRCCHTVISSSEMRRISRPLAKEIDKRLSTAAEYAEHMALTPPSRSIFQYGRRRRTSDLGCTAGLITVIAPHRQRSRLRVNALTSNDIRNGTTIEIDGAPWRVMEFLHVKPGKGAAFVRSKLKNYLSGAIQDKTFRAGESLQAAMVERRDSQFSYVDGDDVVFMDSSTYEESRMKRDDTWARWVKEGDEVTLVVWNGQVITVEVPKTVTLQITESDPGLQGNRSAAGSKTAVMQTGAVVQVPLFIEQGETIRVDTRSGEYLGRA